MNREELPVTLNCSECGCDFDVSSRHARSIRRGDYARMCSRCRGLSRRCTASPKVTEAERQYWIRRFGLSGAIELSLAIWGPIPKPAGGFAANSEPERLVASAVSE